MRGKKRKYTYDYFIASAQNSVSKSMFIKKYRRLFEYAKTMGWYSSYQWGGRSIENNNNYVIYCYKDIKKHAVYVGLTNNLKKRHYGHLHSGTVCDYFKSSSIPAPEILQSGLSVDVARKQEHFFVNLFREQGWFIINKAKTGEYSSSLGSNNITLTYEICFIASQLYKSKSEFQKKDVSKYRKSLEMGWIDNWFTNVDRKIWSRDKCLMEAKKYRTKSEFRINNQSAYNSALKNGWLTDYYWFVKPNRHAKWNESTCCAAAKLCFSRTEYAKKYSSAYKLATRQGWINNYDWFKDKSFLLKKHKKWTYEKCRDLAKKYKKRWDFGKENSGAYHACLKNKWLDSFEWFDN